MSKEKLVPETAIQKEIMLDMSKNGNRGFRNNVGLFVTKDGRRIKTGLGNGTSDIIGFTSVEITQDMVGKRVAIFTAVEVKREKKKGSELQEAFISFVRSMGGIAGLAWTVEMSRDLTTKINLPSFKG